jgi:hypothetical protein
VVKATNVYYEALVISIFRVQFHPIATAYWLEEQVKQQELQTDDSSNLVSRARMV